MILIYQILNGLVDADQDLHSSHPSDTQEDISTNWTS